MDELEPWCEVRLEGADGSSIGEAVLGGRHGPDIGAVNLLARLALWAGRDQARLRLSRVSPGLRELLQLGGLDGALGLEAERQAEGREEALVVEEVEEEVHLDDLPA